MCKEIAWGSSGYNGCRGIFFRGKYIGGERKTTEFNEDYSRVPECDCHGKHLILAPEDAEEKVEHEAQMKRYFERHRELFPHLYEEEV
jgi:hypothetical protein